MPEAAQFSISDFWIGREALAMSSSPRQNFLKPPPVPETPTVTLIRPWFWIWNSSATASLIGYTVLEPSSWMTWAAAAFGAGVGPASPPEAAGADSFCAPQAASATAIREDSSEVRRIFIEGSAVEYMALVCDRNISFV